jgi:hypothetical protein
MNTPMDDLQRCYAEQAECAASILGGSIEREGAERGMGDWVAEEILIRRDLKAPFPWFGGKSRVASIVWDRFGNTPNYVEPFCGSLAVLLGRPHPPGTETVNDKDAFLVNFWRSLSFDSDGVAKWADWPVSEADLIARHRWLVSAFAMRGSVAANGTAFWGDSVTEKHGTTGVFLDPPYSSEEHAVKYSANSDVGVNVARWAIENGNNPLLRIALCGYDGEHSFPDSWECVAWKARGGYGSQADGRGRDNAARERIWFSPHCLKAGGLFAGLETTA